MKWNNFSDKSKVVVTMTVTTAVARLWSLRGRKCRKQMTVKASAKRSQPFLRAAGARDVSEAQREDMHGMRASWPHDTRTHHALPIDR